MKSKKTMGIMIVLVIIVGLLYIKFSDLRTNDVSNINAEIRNINIPVETIKVTEQQMDITTEYVGAVRLMPNQEISFEKIEKIEKIYVKKGMLIQQGDPILQIEVSNSDKDLINDLFDQLDKRDEAFIEKEDAKEEFEDVDEDDDDYEDLKDDYEYLQEVYEVEKQEYEDIRQKCKEYFVFCEMDGYVAEVNVKNGSYAYPYQTVVELGFEENAVVIGIPSDIVDKIKTSLSVTIIDDEIELDGKIFDIAELPSQESNIYSVSISYDMDKNDLQIGDVVTVELSVGNKEGMMIPINTILNDGNDYVFVIDDNVAIKKYIEVGEIINDFALVDGIREQDELIINGMKNIQSGSNIDIKNAY